MPESFMQVGDDVVTLTKKVTVASVGGQSMGMWGGPRQARLDKGGNDRNGEK